MENVIPVSTFIAVLIICNTHPLCVVSNDFHLLNVTIGEYKNMRIKPWSQRVSRNLNSGSVCLNKGVQVQ